MKLYFSNSGCSIEAEDFLRIVRLTHSEIAKTIFDADIVILHFCALSTEVITYIPHILGITDELKKHNQKLKVFVGGPIPYSIPQQQINPIRAIIRNGNIVQFFYLNFNFMFT